MTVSTECAAALLSFRYPSNNGNNDNNGLYFTQDKDTYRMLQLFMNTVKHNKINKLIIES